MTYYDTQQQYLNNLRNFNPQQWAPFSFATPPGSIRHRCKRLAVMDLVAMDSVVTEFRGRQAYGQQYGQYGGQPPAGAFGYNPGWGRATSMGRLAAASAPRQQDVSVGGTANWCQPCRRSWRRHRH